VGERQHAQKAPFPSRLATFCFALGFVDFQKVFDSKTNRTYSNDNQSHIAMMILSTYHDPEGPKQKHATIKHKNHNG
jgi:hypothetical protein